jgi:hypothetical protein
MRLSIKECCVCQRHARCVLGASTRRRAVAGANALGDKVELSPNAFSRIAYDRVSPILGSPRLFCDVKIFGLSARQFLLELDVHKFEDGAFLP